MSNHHIRSIDASSRDEILLVAQRMRQTLVEVLGEKRGTEMYSMEWLEQRVRWHLDATAVTAAVFVAVNLDARITGHTIVRVERDADGSDIGLFSTTYVAAEYRRQGIAEDLLVHGEKWMMARGLTIAATYTADTNSRLVELYRKHGYAIVDARSEMVRLQRSLPTE